MSFRSLRVKMRVNTIDSLNFVFVNQRLKRDEFIDCWVSEGLRQKRVKEGFSK